MRICYKLISSFTNERKKTGAYFLISNKEQQISGNQAIPAPYNINRNND
jgi:hypothetical protein